jgi:hypothetical protein
MNSLAPYTIRVFNPHLTGVKPNEKFCLLGKFGAFDAFNVMKGFILEKNNDFHLLEDSKMVYRFENVVFDPQKRTICGWFQLGTYGTKHDIINVKTGAVDYQKTKEHAEIINHFLYFDLPKTYDEGVALLHIFRGNGIKTVFLALFSTYFEAKTGFKIRMFPLSYAKALKNWEDASAKEIRLIQFEMHKDLADKVKGLGHDEQIMIMKAPRKGMLGTLKDYLNRNSPQAKAVELLAPLCEQVKTVVELNGKKRVFSIGANAKNAICEIEAPDTLELVDGIPTTASMKEWCFEISSEFKATLYK